MLKEEENYTKKENIIIKIDSNLNHPVDYYSLPNIKVTSMKLTKDSAYLIVYNSS